MTKVVIFGNSGSGKSTLAARLAKEKATAHLDLDTIAWEPEMPPERLPLQESEEQLRTFTRENRAWVIEGCYADLLELALAQADEAIFLNLPVEDCIQNAKARPWEPHKYASKEAQDTNLEMLIDWISQYPVRTDTFSQAAHRKLYESFKGAKSVYTSNTHASHD